MKVYETVFGDFRGIVLENEWLCVTLLPELGSKVVSLYDRLHQKEWLTQIEKAKLRRAQSDERWSEDHCGGWDECFPNIAPGVHPSPPWQRVPLADHGELWSRPWSDTISDERVTTSIQGLHYPYTFERALHLNGPSLRLNYRVTNTGPSAFPCMWAMHPLFAIDASMQIELPALDRMTVDYSSPAHAAMVGKDLIWPVLPGQEGSRIDLSQVMAPERELALKLYGQGFTQGWAALTAPSHWLVLRFDPAVVPFLGLWLNYHGWPKAGTGLSHVALEPCTGMADDLAVALGKAGGLVLAPESEYTWQVELTVGSQRAELEWLLAKR